MADRARVVTAEDARRQVRSGRIDDLYLVLGEDPDAKRGFVDDVCGRVDEELQAFNVDRFHGAQGGASLAAVVEAARTVPFMAPRRVVILFQADALLMPKRESEAAARDLDGFLAYLEAPSDTSCLVLIPDLVDERRAVFKVLTRQATVVQCEGLADPRAAARWVQGQAQEHRVTMDRRAVASLVARAAGDVGRLRTETEKLLLFAGPGGTVDADTLESWGGRGAAGGGPWAVTNAVERGTAREALRELAIQLEEGASPYMVLGQLGWCARTKLDSRRAPRAIEAVFRTDLAMKRSGGDPRILLERLVVELCETRDGRP